MTTLVNLLPWLPGYSGFGSYVQRVMPGVQGTCLQLNSAGAPVMLPNGHCQITTPGWAPGRWMRLLQRYSLLQHGLNLDAVLAENGSDIGDFEVIYSPFFDALLGWQDLPQLITCHDLTPLVQSNSRKAWLRYRFWQPRHVSAAARLIAISRYVADQLIGFGASPDRVVVIPNGIVITRPRVLQPASENLLVLARHDLNKNLTGLLRCLAGVQRRRPRWRGNVTIVGRGGVQSPGLREACARLPRPQQVQLVERLGSQELINTLRGSLALVSASTEEGFDYPVLEAKAEGIPTLISDIPVHREFHAGSSLLFPVDDDGEIFAAHLDCLLHDHSGWNQLSEQGYQLAAELSVTKQQRAIRHEIASLC